MTDTDQPLLFGFGRSCLGILILAITTLTGGCGATKEENYNSPEGYDLESPIVVKLPLELDEISGVVFYQKDTSVLAINDEFGMLYKIFLNRPKQIHKWKFSEGADFEDLALLDTIFYVLKSTGDILTFRFDGDSISLIERKFPVGEGNEFEILYFDPQFNKLMLICKDCESDKKKWLSTYTYDPWTFEFTNDTFRIDVTRIATMAGEDKMKFKPSAANIHPITGDLYIISSVNKLLVRADRNGNAIEVFRIDAGLFKQPEGLTFTPRGTMIISNESADIGVANLLIFPYKQKAIKAEQ